MLAVMDDISYLSIRELGYLLRDRQIGPVELTRHALDRLDSIGRGLNAVVTLTGDIALKQARLAEDEMLGGLDRGLLHGLPYGLKDVIAAVGAPTTWGAEPFRHQSFTEDATVTRRLRQAGAILCAKLATIEIAGGMGYDYLLTHFVPKLRRAGVDEESVALMLVANPAEVFTLPKSPARRHSHELRQ